MVKSNIRQRVKGAETRGVTLPHCNTLIRNVQILDGTGVATQADELAIADGVIERIGSLSGYTAERMVDGEGKVLAPGFIDAHTHDGQSPFRGARLTAEDAEDAEENKQEKQNGPVAFSLRSFPVLSSLRPLRPLR